MIPTARNEQLRAVHPLHAVGKTAVVPVYEVLGRVDARGGAAVPALTHLRASVQSTTRQRPPGGTYPVEDVARLDDHAPMRVDLRAGAVIPYSTGHYPAAGRHGERVQGSKGYGAHVDVRST